MSLTQVVVFMWKGLLFIFGFLAYLYLAINIHENLPYIKALPKLEIIGILFIHLMLCGLIVILGWTVNRALDSLNNDKRLKVG